VTKGHVRRHGGRWYAIIFQGRRVNKKGKLADSYRWIGGFDTQGEANEEIVRQQGARLEGSYVEPHRMTVAAYLRHWLSIAKMGITPKTFERYTDICERNIIPSLGPIELVKLTAIDIEKFYSNMLTSGRKGPKDPKKDAAARANAGLSPTTVLQFHRVLHKALRDAVKKRIVTHNVANAAQAPRAATPELDVPDEGTMAALITGLRHDRRVWLPTVIACGTGLRRGEILGLKWTDINWDASTARVVRSLCQIKDRVFLKDVKQKKSRRNLNLPPFVMAALRDARVEQERLRKQCGPGYKNNGLVCCLPDGDFIPPYTVTRVFRDYRISLGLSTRFHDLRHGHASQGLQNGVPVKTMQVRLGHSTAAFTLDRYGHLLAGDDERAADTIQRTIGAALQTEMNRQVN
jgi:integrase